MEMIPPDRERCQCEWRGGSFMTFGPRMWIRCESKPVVIVWEKEADAKGQRGAMSLCAEHLKEFLKRDNRPVTIEQLT